MEETDTNANGWHNSRGKKCCDALFNMIPSSLQPIFKTFTVYSATKGGSDTPGLSTASGNLSLFAEKEVFGTKSYCTQDEFNSPNISQIEYYETSTNRIKKLGDNGSNDNWIWRSPFYNNTTHFVFKYASSTIGASWASSSYGFSPFGVI